MPDEENVSYPAWKAQIDARLDSLNGPVALVGHSVGGSLLLKYLCERPARQLAVAADIKQQWRAQEVTSDQPGRV